MKIAPGVCAVCNTESGQRNGLPIRHFAKPPEVSTNQREDRRRLGCRGNRYRGGDGKCDRGIHDPSVLPRVYAKRTQKSDAATAATIGNMTKAMKIWRPGQYRAKLPRYSDLDIGKRLKKRVNAGLAQR
jgi:hypothetical protein